MINCRTPSQAWFEDFGAGGITSVSFAANLPPRLKEDSESAFRVPDFVVGTNRAYVVACVASAFEELDPERRYATLWQQREYPMKLLSRLI